MIIEIAFIFFKPIHLLNQHKLIVTENIKNTINSKEKNYFQIYYYRAYNSSFVEILISLNLLFLIINSP